MNDRSIKRESGFSLLEMTVSVALGTIVLGAAVQIYIQGVSATWRVSQRAEMQQDFRAASNILTKDLSLAGAGLGQGVAIPLESGLTPKYGCDQTPKCYINNATSTPTTYPLQGATPYLYGLLPGYNMGPTLNTAQGPTDVITVVYTDNAFYLNCYTATVTSKGVVTFAPPVAPATWATEGCLPSTWAAPQAVNDAVVGLTPGDLVLMTLSGAQVVAEVTGAVSTSTNGAGQTIYKVPFANGDPLNMNQTPASVTAPASPGLNSAVLNSTGASPARLLVITYYLDSTVTPARLMRQISGHSPIPVAENVVYMKFSYDLFNATTGTPEPGQTDGGVSLGLTPNQITKINILHMAMTSAMKGWYGGYQGLDLQTSVSARNLTFTNDYPVP